MSNFEKDIDEITNSCIRGFVDEGVEISVSKKARDVFIEEAKRRARDDSDFDVLNALNEIRVDIIERARRENDLVAFRKLLTLKAKREFRDLLAKNPTLSTKDVIQIWLDGLKKDRAGEELSVSARQFAQVDANYQKLRKGISKIIPYSEFRGDKNLQLEVVNLFLVKDFKASDKARAIKKVLDSVNEDMRRLANNNGADIGLLDTFFAHQVHVPDKLGSMADTVTGNAKMWIKLIEKHRTGFTVDMRKVREESQQIAYQRWKSKIMPLLDHEKTFENIRNIDSEIDAVMFKVYKNILRGFKIIADQDDPDEIIASFGATSLAKRVSSHRFFHFKDAESYLAYNMEYGNGSIALAIESTVSSFSKQIGLLEKAGPNPHATFDEIKKIALAEADKRGEPEPNLRKKQAIFNVLKGVNNIPVTRWIANIGTFFRNWASLFSLGRVMLSSINDITVGAMNLRSNAGENIFSAFSKMMAPFFSAVAREERAFFTRAFAVNAQVRMGVLATRFGAFDSGTGVSSRIMQNFFKLTGLTWWDASGKDTAATVWGQVLGEKKNIEFDNLPKNLKRTFSRFGISKNEWDFYRESSVREKDNDFIGPTGEEDFTTDAMQRYLQRVGKSDASDFEKENTARDVDMLLSQMFKAQVEASTLTPGATESALITWGTERGTLSGELVRSLMQFKIFTLTYVRKTLAPNFRRAFRGNESEALEGENGISDLISLMLTSTMLGFVGIELKDATAGKTTPLTAELATRSFLQGGGLGFYTDWMFGNYSKYGQSITGQLLGPAFGTLDDAARMGSAIIRQNNPWSATRNFVKNNTPLVNLWYTNWAFNYTFLFSLSNWMDPGYVQRVQRRRERENDSSYILAPSKALDPFGSL